MFSFIREQQQQQHKVMFCQASFKMYTSIVLVKPVSTVNGILFMKRHYILWGKGTVWSTRRAIDVVIHIPVNLGQNFLHCVHWQALHAVNTTTNSLSVISFFSSNDFDLPHQKVLYW